LDNFDDGHHGALQSGRVSLGFIGGAEVDRFGNLNTTYIRGGEDTLIRLPGSGGEVILLHSPKVCHYYET